MNPWSNNFIPVPFKERGRQMEGADCWGLTCLIYKARLGIVLPTLDDYVDTKDRKRLCEIIQGETPRWYQVPAGEEKEFDLAVFNMAGLPMHVGVVLRPNYMIHCIRGAGTSVERYDSKKWCNRVEGFYRYTEGLHQPTAVPTQ